MYIASGDDIYILLLLTPSPLAVTFLPPAMTDTVAGGGAGGATVLT
jgi:hypothetical protein